MPKWIPCGGGFIEADVIRWKEGVFAKPGRRSKRAINIGDLLVIAEVLRDAEEDGWVYLLIRGCEVVSEKTVKKIERLKNGMEVKRQRSTIMRGKPERLRWSDEGARALLRVDFLETTS
jgi:hypothetical protein